MHQGRLEVKIASNGYQDNNIDMMSILDVYFWPFGRFDFRLFSDDSFGGSNIGVFPAGSLQKADHTVFDLQSISTVSYHGSFSPYP